MSVSNHKKADIVTVANAARVSPATVSRFFNRPELVKPATRKKIDRAVKKLGYIRNRAAQTIHGIRSGTVGLISRLHT
jgi:LacI family transcriptional regulator